MVKHLAEFRQHRERQTILRLLVESPSIMTANMLGIPGWHWLGLSIPSHRLGRERSKKPGDVDVCGGPLVPVSQDAVDSAFREAAEIQERTSIGPLHPEMEKIRALDPDDWERGRAATRRMLAEHLLLSRGDLRPSLNPTFAFEVKVTWFSADGVLKASKVGGHPQKMARKQAHGLAQMGFDHVGLLRILVTEPCPHPNGSAWLHAGSHASAGLREYERAILASEEDPFRTIVAGVGAVDGRSENEAASMSVNLFPVGQWRNPLAVAGSPDVREDLRAHFSAVLRDAPGPRMIPMLVLACGDDACGRLFVPSDELPRRWKATCPDCGGPTTTTSLG